MTRERPACRAWAAQVVGRSEAGGESCRGHEVDVTKRSEPFAFPSVTGDLSRRTGKLMRRSDAAHPASILVQTMGLSPISTQQNQ